jgi:hypothetical protein
MKKALMALALVVCTAIAAHADTYKWTINKVDKNMFDTNAPTEPNTRYMMTIGFGHNGIVNFGANYSELKPILDYWGLKNPEDLGGQSFESSENVSYSAFKELQSTAAHKGSLIPLSPMEIVERAYRSLVVMKCPDYEDLGRSATFKAFHTVYNHKGWLEEFKVQIALRSKNNSVRLIDHPIENFSITLNGQASYLLLKNLESGEEMPVILRPTATPFICEKVEKKAEKK